MELILSTEEQELLLTQLSQLRRFFGFVVMIFVQKSCVFIVGI